MYEFPDGTVKRSDLPAARLAHIAISDVAIATDSPASNLQGAAVHTEASSQALSLRAAHHCGRPPTAGRLIEFAHDANRRLFESANLWRPWSACSAASLLDLRCPLS